MVKDSENLKRMLTRMEEERRKEREAFAGLSSEEKFEMLRKAIADLDMRFHEHIFDGPHVSNEATGPGRKGSGL